MRIGSSRCLNHVTRKNDYGTEKLINAEREAQKTADDGAAHACGNRRLHFGMFETIIRLMSELVY